MHARACVCMNGLDKDSDYFPWRKGQVSRMLSQESESDASGGLGPVPPLLGTGSLPRLPLGPDTFANHLAHRDRPAHRPAVPGDRERSQEGPEQLRLPVLLHAVPHVCCPHAYGVDL